ncbi:MAG: MBL fold metallo-hydrolase, partial [Candidatus Paceibacterota bacterium]
YVEGLLSFNVNSQGTERGMNTIYIIRMEDMRLCHMGDLGQTQLTNEQIEAIGDVDILFIPVGGKYTIDGAQAADIARALEPKVIIPMHYKVPGLNIDLDDSKKFLREIGIKPEEVDVFKIAKKNLPQEETKLITFKI